MKDALRQGGHLSSGRSTENDQGWNEAYDTGANVGEWLWALFHGQNVNRAPWVCRSDSP